MAGTKIGAKIGWAKRKGEYILQKGDTIQTLADKLGVSPEAIIEASGLTSVDQVKLGLKVRIPLK